MTEQKLTYCGELVRKYDSDRFIISLLMPPEARPALWALFAFNHEIAKTREVVTETTLGLIRLQWWRDALTKIFEEDVALQNEIMPALHEAIRLYDLPREWLERMIYAREYDLENVPPASLAGLENYADYTHGPLVRLALRVLGQEEDEETVRAIAAAYTMAGLIRAVRFHAAQHRCMLPADLLAAHGVSERNLYEMKPEEGLREAVRVVAARAHTLVTVTPHGRLLKAMKILTQLYLKQIKGVGYDAFSPRLAHGPAFFHLRFLIRYYLQASDFVAAKVAGI